MPGFNPSQTQSAAPSSQRWRSADGDILFLSFFVKAAFFMESIGPGHNALLPINLWVLQIPLGLLFLFWNIKVLRDTKGATLLF